MLLLSEAELLLRSSHGRCGHRWQPDLPCATPGCRFGTDSEFVYARGPDGRIDHAFWRIEVPFGDEKHYLWQALSPSEPPDRGTK